MSRQNPQRRTDKKFKQDALVLKKYLFTNTIMPRKGSEPRMYKFANNTKYSYNNGVLSYTRREILDELFEGHFIETLNAFSVFKRKLFVEYLVENPKPNKYLSLVLDTLLRNGRLKQAEIKRLKNETDYKVKEYKVPAELNEPVELEPLEPGKDWWDYYDDSDREEEEINEPMISFSEALRILKKREKEKKIK